MSTIDASSALSMQDIFSTSLSGTISSTDTVLTLASVPNASEGFLVLELGTNTEYIYYNSKTSNTVTCPSVARGRGQGGTTAVAHNTGASVKQVVNADYWKELQNGNANTGMQTYFSEGSTPYVASGCVWTGDALASTRVASMTSGVVYVAGKRLVVAAVVSRTFTASKDTYIDVTVTTGSNAGTVVYTEVTNNAASPALAASSVRIGIVVTGATTIAAAGSINQGEQTRVLPIASSTAYSVTDSLGNLIGNRSPVPTNIGYAQITADFTGGSSTDAIVTGLSTTVIIPAGRKYRVTAYASKVSSAGTTTPTIMLNLYSGASVGTLTTLLEQAIWGNASATANFGSQVSPSVDMPPLSYTSNTTLTFNAAYQTSNGTYTLGAGATKPAWIKVDLI